MVVFLANTIGKSYGSTLLTDLDTGISVNIADSFGMPTSVSIDYISDFDQAEVASTLNKAWLQWTMISGNMYYTADDPSSPGTMTVDSETKCTIDLTRGETNPLVGD